MTDTSAATMVSTIKETLAGLYAKKLSQMSAAEKTLHFANVKDLEASLAKWQAIATAEANTTSGGLRQCEVTFRGMN